MSGGDDLLRSTPTGIIVCIRVIPRARHTETAGVRGDALVVRVAAPPVEGAANDAVVEFFAEALQVPRRAIRILSGERGRRKRVSMEGVTADVFRARLLDPST